ncbi:YceI family protein [Streptomyces sp. SID3212]|uniref:YceI family protein n=1 Tax=unclassified Streptomyces TaxID=2593676 RepID=UPI00136F5EC5|nr:YceI family protein [Streptomyces sp. SID3212]MYV55110.1 polyisoprenoid-binding protein [Streptomyces sp. SID3212]
MALFGRKSDGTTATREIDPALVALTGTYAIDPSHSKIGFSVRHAMVTNVHGAFTEFEGSLELNGTDPAHSTASIVVTIASVDTGAPDRDGHLLTGDFFDAEQFPKMTFTSTSAEELGGESYRINGDLTIKDVTKPLSIDLEFNGAATDAYGNERVGFEGGATILRSDWGLTWNAALEAGGVVVSDKVKLLFDISAIKKAPEAV